MEAVRNEGEGKRARFPTPSRFTLTLDLFPFRSIFGPCSYGLTGTAAFFASSTETGLPVCRLWLAINRTFSAATYPRI